MTQQTSPFLEGKFGWDLGESNWNLGMDENLLKFSYMFDKNVDSITATLPAPVNGQAHFLTTDNRIYFAAGGIFYSSPTPKWFTIQLRTSGDFYQFNGTSLVQVTTPTQLQSQIDDLEEKVVVRSVVEYGAVLDGVTNDGPAIRLALDALPATGGVIDFPEGSQVKVVGTIYIPQRNAVSGVEGLGVHLRGNNSTIIGDGTSVVFESGTGSKSTVALGGASNFPQADESAASVHYNSSLEGFNFKACGGAVKLKNWIQGCVIKQLYATNFTGSMIETYRCFYLAQRDIQGRPFREDRADATPIFKYLNSNNTMSFENIHGSGISPTSLKKGVVFEFDQGVQGVVLGGGISAEGAKIGLHLKSTIYSMGITGVYFELCETGIKSTSANLNNLVIDYNEFEDCIADVNLNGWIDGYFGAGNKTEGTVFFGTGSTHLVDFPAQTLSELTHTTWVSTPPGWTVPGGCQVRYNDIIYNSAVGFDGIWFRNEPVSSGGTGVRAFKYTGECFNVGGIIPYCTVTGVGGTTLTVTTKIVWNPNLSTVRFDISVIHGPTDTIAGTVSANNSVFREDATAFTVASANSGGFLQLTLGGFGTITSYSGKVRII